MLITYTRIQRPVAGGTEFANIDADLRNLYPNAAIETYADDGSHAVLAWVDPMDDTADLTQDFPEYSVSELSEAAAVEMAEKMSPARTTNDAVGEITYGPWSVQNGKLKREIS